MKKEDKDLLLKDLCARLPYGVMVHFEGWNPEKLSEVNLKEDVYNGMGGLPIPYLRPMSSMTEEEEIRFQGFKIRAVNSINIQNSIKMIDWLLEHHFDFRGLISKGLALEASNDMYKEEDL